MTPTEPPKSHQTGKGFQAPSFEEEQKVLNKEWAARRESISVRCGDCTEPFLVTRARIETRNVLSETAKSVIVADMQNTHSDGPRANEPSFMKPPANPDQYSHVDISPFVSASLC